jgi:hypothetical protein
MRYTTRPLSDRTWLRPAVQRKRSAFDATWSTTLELLDREVRALGGRDVVIEVDVREQDIRLDGMLRANARAESPAVVVAFETRAHGPMLYRCDRFERSYRSASIGWQENIRAIAKTLEALRAVDRYGATETGQQYAGFKALPAGRAMGPSHMTSDQAVAVIAAAASVREHEVRPDLVRIVRRARAFSHPDRNDGDQTAWDQVEQAAKMLGVSR